MTTLGIKNWHWRTKGVEVWARDWFAKKLTGLESGNVVVTKVVDVEGDAELGMRKSKLVTIYDLKVTMNWETKGDDESKKTKGMLGCSEVSHDMDDDDYVQEISQVEGPADASVMKDVKDGLWKKVVAIFQEFPKAIIECHGKDLLQTEVNDGPTPSAGVGAGNVEPAPTPKSVSSGTKTTTTMSSSKNAPSSLNTTQVSAAGEFMVDAQTLFDMLTDANKVPMWTRNAATIAPTPGAPISLFGGNIVGQMKSVDAPKHFRSTWRSSQWPENHYGELDASLDQGSSSTNLTLRLSGVPIGEQDEAQNNLYKYYIQALKQAGLGTLL